MNTFKSLGLSDRSLQALEKKGFEEPTEIQSITIPLLLENNCDIIAQAQTGTGKTAAFGLPLIEKLDLYSKNVQAIILAPTRELVIQVCEEINSLKGDADLSISPIYGGQNIVLQLKKLKKGLNIVVGTPGRILDHIKRRSLKLHDVKFFILDEADEMLNMGFIEDIEEIFEKTPEGRRVLLFSATMPDRIKKLAEKYMGEYKHLKTKTKLTTNLTNQIYFEVFQKDKFESLCRIIDIESTFYGIIFCRTKVDVDDLVSHLIDRGYSSDALHGDISQSQREKILGKFRKQAISILVATDVAARGIDVNNLTHVINYSIPHNPEAYIHRIGRTGRAGNQGTAITFITPAEFRKLGFIKRVTKADIKKRMVPEINEVLLIKKDKISKNIKKLVSHSGKDYFKKWATELLEEYSSQDIVRAVLEQSFGKELDEKNYLKLSSLNKRGERLNVEKEGKTRLFIAKGKKDSTTKRSIIDFIVKKTDIKQRVIDNIEIHDNFSFVTVPFAEAEIILRKFKSVNSGRKSLIEKANVSKTPQNKRPAGRGFRNKRNNFRRKQG